MNILLIIYHKLILFYYHLLVTIKHCKEINNLEIIYHADIVVILFCKKNR